MEDDDEFGDLYTDVLSSFPLSSLSNPSAEQQQQQQQKQPPPIDLNLIQSDDVVDVDDVDVDVDVDDVDGAPNSSSQPDNHPPDLNLLGSASPTPPQSEIRVSDFNLLGNTDNDGDAAPATAASDDSRIQEPHFVIPGLDTGPSAPEALQLNQPTKPDDDDAAGDDWDTDSDDDLQIVLNDTNHRGPLPMPMDANAIMPATDDDDDDEDGDNLIIVGGDEDAASHHHHQPNSNDQDWGGEDAQQPADGKDPTDPTKPNGAVPAAPKIAGFNNYGYHPFHSQFKYVRPGAAPLPGGPPGSSGGAVGQVRPPVNMGGMAGRGRGDWRPPGMKGPPMQKGFHQGFWGGSAPGRGLEFTLPSHKNIFDVDIESFEEKPWKYPGVDVSDFFNFGLSEDSWKDYCKQLEQLRLESTMQSKIRVYESGRTEQEYDPDLPPELAAAAGIHGSSAENADTAKADGRLGDPAVRLRPPIPTGRAIQVETGFGERLPSADTRPPRLRDSDAVIEIVLQDSMDEESGGNGASEHQDNDSMREDDKVDAVDEDGSQNGDENPDRYPQGYGGTKVDVTGNTSPISTSPRDDLEDEERKTTSPQRTSSGYHSGSGGRATENVGSPYEDRWTKGNARDRSPHMSSGESAQDRRSLDYQQEESTESIDHKQSRMSSSPNPIEDDQEPSLEEKFASEDDVPADPKPEEVKEDMNVISANSSKNKHGLHSAKQLKLNSRVESPTTKEVDGGDLKASRSSDNSKATGSSRDHQKWREGFDEEVVQNGRSAYAGDLKRHRGEGGHDSQRRDRDGRMEVERNYLLSKGRDEYYSHRDWDPYAANHFHMKSEGMDRRKERDYAEVSWQPRDEDGHGRRVRAEDPRKVDRADEMVSRHRGGKVREIVRSDKDEYLHSKKLLDNGSWRGYHDKDVGLRYREKDDGLKSRHDVLEDRHTKRRKDDEHSRRDHSEREDVMLGHRESSTSRRKRERDDISNHRKRDDQARVRDNIDDHHSLRVKDEVWVQRQRAEQPRERDEWYRPKQSYEENLSRRERGDGRTSIRSSSNVEEKTWVGHSRGKEEYKGHDKDTGRHGEQLNRRDRLEDETSLQHRGSDDPYARGNQLGNEGKRSRQERSSARNDRAVHASDNQRVLEKKHKDSSRKARESEVTAGQLKRHQGEKGATNEMAEMKGRTGHSRTKHDPPNRAGDDVSSDDEQHDSKRGRSKLERWTSHKERDYAINSKASSSLKINEFIRDKTAGSGSSFRGNQDESINKLDDAGGKDVGGGSDVDAKQKPMADGHLDTVEKLKRRSERFKLPLTSEKDAVPTKKMESEPPLPPSQTQTQTQTQNETQTQSDNPATANAEVKQERPARKRRWISS